MEALRLEVARVGSVPTRLLCRILKRCNAKEDLTIGKAVHTLGISCGFETNDHFAHHLIRMYAACGQLLEARQYFDKLPAPSKLVWPAIISAYGDLGQAEEAIQLFYKMRGSLSEPDDYVFVAVLKACTNAAALQGGMRIHAHVVECGHDSSKFVGSALVDMYAKCGSLDEAKRVFDSLPTKDLITWNTMIAGFGQQGRCWEAISLFRKLQEEGLEPNQATFVSALKACTGVTALDQGRLLHAEIMKTTYESDAFVGSTLLDMYSKCGSLEDAREVFDRLTFRNKVTWSAMFTGYVQHGGGKEALQLFRQMQEEGMEPDKVCLLNILKACSMLEALEEGRLVHSQVVEQGFLTDTFVGNTLIYMYAKCESLVDARMVFDTLPRKDLVSWNAMISAYAQQGSGQDAIGLFHQMQVEAMQPNQVTLVSILKACSSVAALDHGKKVHEYIVENEFQKDVTICNILIDMYAKCGSLHDALSLFNTMPTKTLVSWNAMIGGYAQFGSGRISLGLFEEMLQHGIQPDSVTFVSLLSACSHSGLLHEGMALFRSMTEDYDLSPHSRHHVCVVDLLGRSGKLDEAEQFIREVPVDSVLWLSLLGACRTRGNVELGRRSFEAIMRLGDPVDASPYVLMSDIYIAAGRADDAAEIRRQMQSSGVKKEPGRTWMEIDNKVHTFVVKDDEHPERRDIYAKLKSIVNQIERELGYGRTQPMELAVECAE